jgi:hypothetical protein
VNTYDLYLYIDGVPTVDQVSRVLDEFGAQWDGQMGWWITDPKDRGSGVRCGLLIEPHVQPIAGRLSHPAMAGIAISTDEARVDKDFVNQLNVAAALHRVLGGSIYDPQSDALLTTHDELSEFASTKVVQYFNQGESFQREVEAAAEKRDLLGGSALWEPSDEEMDSIIRENRGLMVAGLISLVFLAIFVMMAIQKSCGG